jgi:23S rRNA pseudouridine2605 synthase
VDRLQKILSQAGVASRRASEQLMLEGRVTVNGTTVRELGSKADPTEDDVRVDGRRIRLPDRHLYLLLNKPRGYVTTRSDPEKRPTVVDLIGTKEYVYPVGRLDYDSEGLLLLTNDGDLAARLTHPSHGVARVYEARVLGVPDEHDLTRLRRGIPIEGRRTEPSEVELLTAHAGGRSHPRTKGPGARGADAPRAAAKSGATLLITIREGRNRQVRKMLEAIGHPVDHLKRVAIGPIRDERLKVGRWRELTGAEVERLRKAVAVRTPRKPHIESKAVRPERRVDKRRRF